MSSEFLPFNHSPPLKNTTRSRSTQCFVHCLMYACSGGDSVVLFCLGFNEPFLGGIGETIAFACVAMFAVVDVGEGATVDPEMVQDVKDANVVGSREILCGDVGDILLATLGLRFAIRPFSADKPVEPEVDKVL